MFFFFSNHPYIYISKTNKQIKYSIIISALLLVLNGCSASSRYDEERLGSNIRVLLDEESNILINVDKEVFVRDEFKNIASVKRGNVLQFSSNGKKVILKIKDRTFTNSSFSLTSDDNIISINGKKFQGEMNILANSGRVYLINKLDLEEYIKGVIPYEMPSNNERYYECLKAFAICARTYALKRLYQKKSIFDIYSDVKDQIYSGLNSRNELTDKCVDETEGLIITYNGQPAEIFYFSSCGGYTEDGENVFTSADLPYLKSIKDGTPPFCSNAPKSSWTEAFSITELEKRFSDASLIGSDFILRKLEIKSRFRSGRVNELTSTFLEPGTREIKNVSIYGNKIRYVIKDHNNNILKSNFFSISLSDSIYSFTGKGYGHGVGLCQWGALNQSLAGRNYRTILGHYFPGTKIMSIND